MLKILTMSSVCNISTIAALVWKKNKQYMYVLVRARWVIKGWVSVFAYFQRTHNEEDSTYSAKPGEIPSMQEGPLVWSRNGGMFAYNLVCRENSFIQIWHSHGANNRHLNHCLTIHVDIEGAVTIMQGMPNVGVLPEEDTRPSGRQRAQTGSRPVRRSPRVAARQAQYENLTPTHEEIQVFDSLLHANLQGPGNYDSSIHTTIWYK